LLGQNVKHKRSRHPTHSFSPHPMPWNASLILRYQRRHATTTVAHKHLGPLRIFHSHYPQGPGLCHNVLIHPPGGLVGGDRLDIRIHAEAFCHALLTTPGATRFYRSLGADATQSIDIELEQGAKLEWLPMETLAYPGCQAVNSLRAKLAPEAQLLAWEVTALGLPISGQPFDSGFLQQRIEIADCWLDQGRIDALDKRLMDSPLGLAGQRCLGTLVLASGSPWPSQTREALLQSARDSLAQSPTATRSGATCTHDRVLVVRALGPLVEPVMQTLKAAWRNVRACAWGSEAAEPRIWKT